MLATRASAEAGDFGVVARLLVTHFAGFLQRPAEGLPGDFYELVYPRPFVDAVTSAAGGRDLDPAFMFSLMRQESRFDPAARSLVGALGLFQIMPYTATDLGPRSGLDHLSSADFENATVLLQPPVNAAIAATLASDLFALFGGALAPVIASYNAGEERVATWWESARGSAGGPLRRHHPLQRDPPVRARSARERGGIPARVRRDASRSIASVPVPRSARKVRVQRPHAS